MIRKLMFTNNMAASMGEHDDVVYMIVNNIPKIFHASDLRNFFSSFIETGGFVCFHFRHRPEVQKPSETLQNDGDECSRRVTNCCVTKVHSKRATEFLKSYNREHWLDKKGETLMTRCFIKKLFVSDKPQQPDKVIGPCKKGTVFTTLPINQETFTQSDIDALIEMHPPTFMPNGNVGTKTSYFLQEISACRLPPSLISKLDLQFPRNRARRIYGNVPFDYVNRQNNKSMPKLNHIHSRGVWLKKLHKDTPDVEEKNEESESEEEEWDRHESLHDDVTGQERSKERLFEEEIELKWEKGGSGLVFYTDAQFWDAKEGDFDAKTADDWDIDTNIYRDPGMDCDKDSRDLLRMRLEQAVRDGTETKVDCLYDFAAFEKYSKGFGRKLMEAQGWKQGLGIGKNCAGIPEPILNDGQKPTDKKGFGYRGEKLTREPRIKKKRRRSFDSDSSFFISTVYDKPELSDPPDSVFTSTSYSKLKFRREFLKEQGHTS